MATEVQKLNRRIDGLNKTIARLEEQERARERAKMDREYRRKLAMEWSPNKRVAYRTAVAKKVPAGDMGSIILFTAKETGVSAAALLGVTQVARVVRARQLAMLRLQKHGASLNQIGRVLNRHHTTVLYGVRKAKEREKI